MSDDSSINYANIPYIEIPNDAGDFSPQTPHFCPRALVEEAGGPVAFVTAWLESKDDGKPVQLSLF